MNIRLVFLFCTCFFATFSVLAQKQLKGQVRDAGSGQALPFATLSWGSGEGVVTDQEGKFSLFLRNDTIRLQTRFIGYKSTEFVFLSDTTQYLIIELEPDELNLKAVTVYAGENPAHIIIRKVVANKDKNNPLLLSSFQYKSYNQFYIRLEPVKSDSTAREGENSKAPPDSLTALQTLADSGYLFFNESVTLHRRQKGVDRQKVLGSQTAGVRSLLFTTVATDLQPFAFYEEYITLLGQDYLNPVTPNSWKRYNFQLTDSLVTSTDTTFVISYQPQEGKNFRGLSGVLYISSDGYALRNVIAESGEDKSLTRLRIRQVYEKQEEQWFPSGLYANLYFPRYKVDGLSMVAEVQTIVKEVDLNPPDTASLSRHNVEYAEDAGKKDSLFWERERTEPLSVKARNTFSRIEGGREGKILNFTAWFVETLLTNSLQVGWFDVKLNDFLKYNEYEGLRPGIGLSTNSRFSKKVEAGVYAGWGLADEALKYSGYTRFLLQESSSWYLKGSIFQDLREPGRISLEAPDDDFLLDDSQLRNWYLERLDSVEGWNVQTGLAIPSLPGLELAVGLEKISVNPTYNYLFKSPSDLSSVHQFQLTEASAQFFYRSGYQTALWEGREIPLGYELPVFGAKISQGITAMGGHFTYTRVEVQGEVMRRWRGFGRSVLKILGGWSTGQAPYHRLFTIRGAAMGNQALLDVAKTFRTMRIHEFAASAYGALLFQHKLGRIRTGLRWSRPDFTVAQHTAWGTLKHSEYHEGIELKTPEEGYTEAGLQIHDILRINYLNVSYLGLGGSIFYRYGTYALPQWKDNLFYQVLIRFSID